MIRVLLVDDLPDVRNMIKLRIALEPDMEVVGEAENSAKALTLATELQPDIVIMDLKMPNGSGIQAIKSLLSTNPERPVIALSLYDDAVTRGQAKEAGAVAFVSKQEAETVLITTIRQAISQA